MKEQKDLKRKKCEKTLRGVKAHYSSENNKLCKTFKYNAKLKNL